MFERLSILLSFISLTLAGVGLSAPDKNKIYVATGSGNAYYVISEKGLSNTEARRDWTNAEWLKQEGAVAADWKDRGCRGKLGDGWHVPSVEDFDKDRRDLESSLVAKALGNKRFWLMDSVERRASEKRDSEAYYAATLAGNGAEKISNSASTSLSAVCVCGSQTSDNHFRRSKNDCLSFNQADTSASVPENADMVLENSLAPIKMSRDSAMAVCKNRNKRVPGLLALALLTPQIRTKLSPAGCVWSEDASGDPKMPYYYWQIEFKEVYKSIANESCAVVCVL